MKHVDMMMILNRAYSETLRMWDDERRKLVENPNSRIAAAKEARYYEQLEEIRGMILAEQKRLSELKQQQTDDAKKEENL